METSHAFQDLLWGVERETHRILGDGSLSAAPHPETLKGPSFTKDFAESQLELVTVPHGSIDETMQELYDLTDKARRGIGSELLWPFSMPPRLPPDGKIVTARMESDGAGRAAERYRRGLTSRYGAARQMICGVHVNVSFGPELLAHLRSRAPLSEGEAHEARESDGWYLRLARNFVEDMPLFVMAFGATPFAETAGANGGASGDAIGDARRSGPAFSIRNSPLGYARAEYRPFLNLASVAEHLAGIERGMRTESESWRRMGLMRNGKPVQLNTRFFQKEKEFYAPIRFKRTVGPGESPLGALSMRGIQYLELRFFDVDPFSPVGISHDAMRVMQLFVLDGLTRVSHPRTNAELSAILGRADSAALADPLVETPARKLPGIPERLESLAPFARALGHEWEASLASFSRALMVPLESASARIARSFLDSGLSWTEFGARLASGASEEAYHDRAC